MSPRTRDGGGACTRQRRHVVPGRDTSACDELRGASRLAVEAALRIADLVEAMQQAIAGGASVLGRPFLAPTRLFSAPVYASVRGWARSPRSSASRRSTCTTTRACISRPTGARSRRCWNASSRPGRARSTRWRSSGTAWAAAAMWIDPHLENTCFIDEVGDSVSFYDTKVKAVAV